MAKTRGNIGDLERSVMEALWAIPDGASLTVREVHAQLAEERDIAYTTVMTVMDRLARKELVHQERDGRAYRYRARGTRGEMTADLMRDTLEEFASHDRRTALAAFVSDASAEDVEALRAALAKLDGA
ncbi:BlaI/MecI/CopY family transcriptional regulator [Nocardioides daejeonensis]|uniref:BlaI/MecI/CopY family transcriptional regulator n=1 Tax=Nocardioides daejeonensis TaxID=1046556 RepID=UPI000D74E19E|nr:BlaI/MecI/CopY family transcriptional regulator [Nocardioides daejeonensis]